jgi:hypothetical protein
MFSGEHRPYLLIYLFTYLLTYLVTYLLTDSMEQSPFEKLISLQVVKKFTTFRNIGLRILNTKLQIVREISYKTVDLFYQTQKWFACHTMQKFDHSLII